MHFWHIKRCSNKTSKLCSNKKTATKLMVVIS